MDPCASVLHNHLNDADMAGSNTGNNYDSLCHNSEISLLIYEIINWICFTAGESLSSHVTLSKLKQSWVFSENDTAIQASIEQLVRLAYFIIGAKKRFRFRFQEQVSQDFWKSFLRDQSKILEFMMTISPTFKDLLNETRKCSQFL